jgi:hypothetical protein
MLDFIKETFEQLFNNIKPELPLNLALDSQCR